MLRVLGKNKLVVCFRNIRFPVKKNRGLKLSFGMGCICSKGAKDENKVKKEKGSKKLVASSRKDDVMVEVDNGGNDATARLISTENGEKSAASTPAVWEDGDKKPMVFEKAVVPQMQIRETMDPGQQGGQPQMCRVLSVRNGVDGAQVVAGWPSWLTSVAGEAIKGWIPRKADSFEKLDKIGQGTYSSVYRARDLETGKVVALKKLDGLVTSRVSGNLYLVFDYMEHDLAGLAASPVVRFTESQIKCFMQQLLRGLEHCHSRGVLHRDIKGSNLLIDNHGNLKIDYGVSVDLWSSGCILAELFAGKPIMPGRTEVEQLHKIFKLCGSPSEEYWKTSKLPHATIFKPQQPYRRCVAETFKDFPPSALSLLESLLAFEPERRGSTTSALHSEWVTMRKIKDCVVHLKSAIAVEFYSDTVFASSVFSYTDSSQVVSFQFFTSKPLPCDPSSLPKYPPSKEYDAKARDEEARRAAGGKASGVESSRKGSKESKAVPAPDANAELQASIQKRKGQSNPKSNSEMYNREEDGGSGFPIEPSRGSLHNGHSMLMGTSVNSLDVVDEGRHLNSHRGLDSSGYRELKTQRSFKPQTAARLSRFSNSVAARGSSQLDFSRDSSVHSHWPQHNTRYEQMNDGESSNHLLGKPDSPYKNNGQVPPKENTTGYALKKTRMHYSGPLLPPGGSVEEMLKEHEKQIQIAVRKARDKNKTRKGQFDNGQTDSLLGYVNNGR
ncbi:hypothetical protein DH2020_024129 [Rehmannia glutinosa]|uniref:Protein kinase domain-containing protein n=1 Tax=Rehmannia glutinosa TaxID=99300 RepID=A0ABR0W817_REHGL